MNETYMGTSLPKDEARAFKVIAAEQGLSIAALLRKLAMATVTATTTRRISKKKGAVKL